MSTLRTTTPEPGSVPPLRCLQLNVRSAMTDPTSDGNVHVPVLAQEVTRLLGGRRGHDDLCGLLVDATLGAGGHSALLLERFPRLSLLGVDQDPEILSIARGRLEPFQSRVRTEHARMSELGGLLAEVDEPVVGVLMDLGASSLQLDRPERGFSFSWDGPLDMRMDPRRQRSAADIVNQWDEGDLADLFFHEGGERGARKVARAIVDARRRAPFRRTRALSELVALSLGRPIRSQARPDGGRQGSGKASIHPATRVFQALRRAVNEEAEELEAGLGAALEHLAPGGRLLAISFHSGEDAVVKRFLASGAREGDWDLVTRRPVEATPEEVRSNPRSRSAKLRVGERLSSDGDRA